MEQGIITQAEIDGLPDDDGAAFVEFERICRQRLAEILGELTREDDDWNTPRVRYMAKVAAAAQEYNIPGWESLTEANPYNFQFEQFRVFDHEVTQITTRLQIKKARERKADTVKLLSSRAADISKYVEILRRRVEASDFDEKKKTAIYKKLDALKSELTGSGRADLSKTMLIIASIATTLSQSEASVIKLPDAIAAVMKVIGYAKGDEDAEKAERAAIAAAATPRAIEDNRPKVMQSKISRGGFSSNLDDEIPF